MKKFLFFFFSLSFSSVFLNAQTVPFQRVSKLGKGMALSWLERYWLGDPTNNFEGYFDMSRLNSRKDELILMKQMGVNTLRLPVWFSGWYSSSSSNPTPVTPQYFAAVDSFVRWTDELNMNIIIDYHQGELTQQNLDTETVRIANIWKNVIKRYNWTDPNRVFFEVYNEPNGITSSAWKKAANHIIDSIRTVSNTHSLIVGGAQFNDIKYLDSLGTLKDNNIIYTFHFYEPFIFTHQGASWVENGVPVSTTKIPFPYNSATMPTINPLALNTWGESSYYDYMLDGTTQTVVNQLKVAKQWQDTYNRPVYCGEFGSDAIYADAESRCRLLTTIRQTMEAWNIPFSWWDWDGGFKMFNNNTPSIAALPDCFFDAWKVPKTPVDSSNDLSVHLDSDISTYKPFSSHNYTITVKNNSSTAFSGVNIEFIFPKNTTNGGSATPSVGKWLEYCMAHVKCYNWSIPNLNPNQTAVLTVPLYILNATEPIVATAKLLSSTPTDDKKDNNTPTLTLLKAVQNASIIKKPTQQVPVVVQSIFPTLTEGELMMAVESLIEEEIIFSISNSMGETIKKVTQIIEKGSNRIAFDMWDLPQGIYFISIENINHKVPMKFVKM